jgi:hypothetical protein
MSEQIIRDSTLIYKEDFTMSNLQDRLKAMLEGTFIQEGAAAHEEAIGEDAVDGDMMAEATIAMVIETAQNLALEAAREFITENAHLLVRDGLLTEDAAGQSFLVLSREAQRNKAESLLKMQMARKANDPRALKVAAMRRTIKRLVGEIHNDSRYNEAKTIVMKRQFRQQSNAAAAMSAKRVNSQFKLR